MSKIFGTQSRSTSIKSFGDRKLSFRCKYVLNLRLKKGQALLLSNQPFWNLIKNDFCIHIFEYILEINVNRSLAQTEEMKYVWFYKRDS